MTAATGWALMATAVLVMPARRVHGVAQSAPPGAPAPRGLAGSGPALAAASGAVVCVAAAGPRAGVPLAVMFAPVAALAVRWLQHRPARAAPDPTLPLVLDLVAAALRSGRPIADALTRAAPAGSPATADRLERVAALARLGADPEQAWSGLPRDGPLGEVARVAVRSATSGLRLAAGLERLADELRAEHAAAAAVRAHRAGVFAMAPLAVCFLPSFVCLGVVPVVVGVARNAFAVLP